MLAPHPYETLGGVFLEVPQFLRARLIVFERRRQPHSFPLPLEMASLARQFSCFAQQSTMFAHLLSKHVPVTHLTLDSQTPDPTVTLSPCPRPTNPGLPPHVNTASPFPTNGL